MSKPQPPARDRDELHRLFSSLCDGTFSDHDAARLPEMLKSDPVALEMYLDHMTLEAHLQYEFGGGAGPVASAQAEEVGVTFPGAEASGFTRQPRLRGLGRGLAVAAGILIGFLGIYQVWRVSRAEPAARILNSAGAEYGEPGMAIAAGSPIPEGEVLLTRGAIALETSRKARVVLEAPATFRFASSQRLVLSRGRMSAEIPPAAKGFTVETPSSEVIDIGTNFGVDVAAGGVSEVHVFKGEVLARAGRSADRHSLRQDQALTLKADRATPRDVRGTAFIQSDEFQRLAAGLRPGRVTGWARSLATLRSEPTLFALPDLAEVSGGSFRRVQGRWPGSTAIEFTQPGDFLPLPLEGTSDALTLAAWVRLDRAPHTINSLLHVDGWGRTGQVHWMVAENQRMRLAVYDVPRVNPPTEQRYPESERPVMAATGRWTHLAVVYDAPRRSVRFYLDGQLDNEVELALTVPVVLGPARVGNWNQVDRMFSGRLDELVVLGRALSDDEIRALYRAGNPYGPVASSPIQSASRW